MRTVTKSMEESQQTRPTSPEKHKMPSPPGKLTAQERAKLRGAISDLLEQAASSEQAAQAALQACLKLRRKVPTSLLTKENIASTLSLGEVARSLDRLSSSEMSLDASAALAAIRVLINREV